MRKLYIAVKMSSAFSHSRVNSDDILVFFSFLLDVSDFLRKLLKQVLVILIFGLQLYAHVSTLGISTHSYELTLLPLGSDL